MYAILLLIMLFKTINVFSVAAMLGFFLLILLFSGVFDFHPYPFEVSSAASTPKDSIFFNSLSKSQPDPFGDLFSSYRQWDSKVGCAQFREKHKGLLKNGSFTSSSSSSSLQDVDGELQCSGLKMDHVSVLVKKWTWIPDNLDNLYACRCGLSCLWTKSSVLADKPDAMLFETVTPPHQVLSLINICSNCNCFCWENVLVAFTAIS